eukprot:1057146-Amorphochlora_amoeboformis.AAC.1
MSRAHRPKSRRKHRSKVNKLLGFRLGLGLGLGLGLLGFRLELGLRLRVRVRVKVSVRFGVLVEKFRCVS